MATRPLHVVVALPDADGDRGRDAMARFRGPASRWLPGPATPTPDGHTVHLATGTLLPVPHVAVDVVVGPTVEASGALVMRTLSWRAVRLSSAFPVLDADLELDGRDGLRLRLVGGYAPPLAVVGDVADRLLGRHLVTEIVRGFLVGIAHRLVPRRNGVEVGLH